MRFSSNTGYPHFSISLALGATALRIARISRNFFWASLGAAAMYSATVVGLVVAMMFSGEGGIRTLGGPKDHNGFRDRPIRPLWHLSAEDYN